MENIKENLVIWLDMCKVLSDFDYEIISSTTKKIKVLIEVDNNKYMVEAYKV